MRISRAVAVVTVGLLLPPPAAAAVDGMAQPDPRNRAWR